MAKIPRAFQKIFGGNASNNGQFGSARTGAKVTSNDILVIQLLQAWANGWSDATISGNNLPTLEEMQGISYVITTQLAYLFQEGIPEYDASTTYFINSLVKNPGTLQIYASLIDNNIGNALSTAADWLLLSDLNATVKTAIVTATLAQINAGLVMIPGVTGKAITILNIAERVSGAFASNTSVDVQSTNATPVKVAVAPVAGLTNGAVIVPGMSSLTLGAGFALALGTGDGLKVVNTGGAATGGTSITFTITYTQS